MYWGINLEYVTIKLISNIKKKGDVILKEFSPLHNNVGMIYYGQYFFHELLTNTGLTDEPIHLLTG